MSLTSRRLIDDQTRFTNRLTSALKDYFPQALDWFDDKATTLFCDFLTRWPTLKQVQLARRTTLESFFYDQHSRSPNLLKARPAAIKSARPLTEDPAVIEPKRLLVEALVEQLRATMKAIVRFDAEIATVCRSLPDYELFRALPGAGPVFAPRLLAAFGEQRDRYAGAGEIQRYVGIAPVTESSIGYTGA